MKVKITLTVIVETEIDPANYLFGEDEEPRNSSDASIDEIQEVMRENFKDDPLSFLDYLMDHEEVKESLEVIEKVG